MNVRQMLTEERGELVELLSNPDPFVRPGRFLKGLRWEATDADWSRGTGPVVRGPGEALVVAMAGRAAALDDLEGDGVPELRRRVEA
ncbi:hypothetical protein [Nocardia sp. NBC_01388]|uniref:hypothetical protein n=1 Tax=Nocardia sp. NBC_01388 TaxID=2903596 RepID=UPI003868B2FB